MFTDHPYRTVGDYYRFRLGAGYDTRRGSLMIASAQRPSRGVQNQDTGKRFGTGGRELPRKAAA